MDAGYFEEYGHYFYPYVGATSSTPAPGEGVFGPYTFGAAGASGSAPPPPPDYGFGTFGAPGTSTMAPLHGTQSKASRPSVAKIFSQSTAASIFGTHLGMSSIATSSLNPSLDITITSFEATTLPANAYLTSNIWIGLHDWTDRTPSDATGNGGNGQ